MSINEIFKQILKKIKPLPQEKKLAFKKINFFIEKLKKEIKKMRIKAQAILGGSFAKGTWLKKDADVDIFVAFDLVYKKQNLSALLEKILKKFKYRKLHGSRDYFQIKFAGFNFEIVPILKIKSLKQAENVTDFSPWHVAWVNKYGKKFKDDILLAKTFLKALGVYGAESYIGGFSGHVADILVIYYKGFENLLKAAAKWKPKLVIDYSKKLGKKALKILNQAKIQGPLIVLDPIQPLRNASASVTAKAFETFSKAAKEFLKNPSINFFIKKKVDLEALKSKGRLLVIDFENLKDSEAVVGAKILKAFEFLKTYLKEFEIIDSGFEWDKVRKGFFWFLFKKNKIPEELILRGPPVKFEEQVKNFKSVHKKTFEKEGRIWALERREKTNLIYLVKEAIENDYIKRRLKKVKIR